jgi:hypothetical protein
MDDFEKLNMSLSSSADAASKNSSSSLLLSTTAFADESMQIFFEFILHGVVLNLVGLVRLQIKHLMTGGQK